MSSKIKTINSSLYQVGQKMRSLTNNNMHSECLVVACDAIEGAENLKAIFQRIAEIHEIEGEMPFDLNRYRYQKSQSLKQLAQHKLSDVEYVYWHQGF